MTETPPLAKFIPLREHVELCRGFTVRIKGAVYHVQYRDPLTKRTKSRRGGITYTEVVETIREIKGRTAIGSPILSGATPLYEVIERWFECEVIPRRKAATAKQSCYYLERFVLPALGDRHVSDITVSVLEEFFRRLDEFDTADPSAKRHVGVSVSQRNVVKKTVKALFRWAHQQGYIFGNPAAGIRLEPEERAVRAVFTPEDVDCVVRFATPYYRPHLMALFYSSMRIGELGALRWDEVTFRPDGRAEVRVRHALNSGVVGTPKTTQSKRLLVLPSFLTEMLRAHQEHQRAAHPPNPDNLVFTTSTGGTLSTARFRERVFYKALKRANAQREQEGIPPLPRIRVHDFRHSSITAYAQHSHDLPQSAVQHHAGHTTQRTTDIYTHLEHERAEAIADVAEQMHRGASRDSYDVPPNLLPWLYLCAWRAVGCETDDDDTE